jgi:hypothetical protein
MVRMFCTLRQAADKLKTTEAEVEAMVGKGVLREFREGSTRLVKISDLAAAAGSVSGPQRTARAGQSATGSGRKKAQSAGSTGRARSLAASGRTRTRKVRHEQAAMHPPRKAQASAVVACEAEIKLPPSAAATVRRNVHSRPDDPAQSELIADSPELEQYFDHPDVDPADRLDVYHAIASERRPTRIPPRPAHSAPGAGVSRRHPAPAFRARRRKPQANELSLKDWVWTGLIDDRPHTILVLLGMAIIGAATVAGIGYLLAQVL